MANNNFDPDDLESNNLDNSNNITDSDEQDSEEEQFSPEEIQKKEALQAEIRAHMLDEYKSREYFMEQINEARQRKVSWSLIAAQLFARHDQKRVMIWIFMALGISVGLLATGQILTNRIAEDTSFVTAITIAVISWLFGLGAMFCLSVWTRSAWIDIIRLKKGFCSLGYLVRVDEGQKGQPNTLTISYKDTADMIQTIQIQTKDEERFTRIPVMMLFMDWKNPHNVTFVENMYGGISYDCERKRFTQSNYYLFALLIPITAIVFILLFALAIVFEL